MNSKYDDLSLKYLIKACIRKFKFFILSFLIIACLLGGFVVLKTVIKPAYLTNSVVLIYPKSASSYSDSDVVDGKLNPQDLAGLKEAAGSYINLINNRWVIYKALDNLDIQVDDVEQFIDNNVSITSINGSPYLNIEIKFSKAEKSYFINQEIINIMPGILKDLNIGANFSVISYPVMPVQPDLPSETMLFVLGIGAALLLGFLFVLLSELFDSTFRTDKDIKRVLDIECIGYLPEVKAGVKQHSSLMNNALKRVVAFMSLSKSRVVALADMETNGSNNSPVYTMARQLCALGYSVLFVDFSEAKSRTVFRTLPNNENNIKYVNINKDRTSLQPGEVTEEVRNLMDEGNNGYDFVLLNVPAANSMYYSIECFDMADMALLMLRHSYTKQDAARRYLNLIGKSSAKNLCCVMYDIKCTGAANYYSEFAQ